MHQDEAVEALLTFLDQRKVTDLFVVSHGWNNDMDDARALYRMLFDSIRAELRASGTLRDRRFAVVGDCGHPKNSLISRL